MTLTLKHPYVLSLLDKDPNLHHLFETVKETTIPFDDDGFHFLIFTITGQQVSAKVAHIIFNRMKALIHTLTPTSFLTLSDQQLRDIGLSFRKIETMKAVAHYCIKNNFNFNTFLDKKKTMSLIHIKGIGPWTLDMYEMFVHKNLDHFSFKDLGLIEAIKYIYPKPLQTIDEIKKVTKRWSPYQSIVAHFLWEYWDIHHKGKRND